LELSADSFSEAPLPAGSFAVRHIFQSLYSALAIILPAMLRFLGDADTWRVLRSIGRNRRRPPLYAAVSFLGNGGGKLLSLRRGDVLIVALTLANSRNGSVCPAEIERLQKAGVRVFLAPDLHAKVFLCGRKTIVSSTNLSQTSFALLDEAAILTNEPRIAKHVRSWFTRRTLEPVTPEWLAVCAKAYRPPRSGIFRTLGTKRRTTSQAVWLLGLELLEEYPKDELEAYKSGRSLARRRLSNAKAFTLDEIRWSGKECDLFQRGDTIIQTIKTSRSHFAEEMARLIDLTRTKTKRGKPVAYLWLESPKRPKRVSWRDFKRECASFGLKLGSRVTIRQLSDSAQAAKVMALVSRG
jgi:hypothetical protein